MAYLGPLTTTFTPADASTCLTSFFYGTNSLGSWLQLGTTDTTSCLPPRFDRTASYYYSPGICPSGYSYACTDASSSDGEPMTIATCCPSGYACAQNPGTSNIFPCTYSLPERTTLTISSLGFGTGFEGSGSTVYTASSGETVRAYGPIVRRQGSDPAWDTAPATASATATGSLSLSASRTSGTTASATAATDGGGGLSVGAKAGIGVGVGVGVLCVVAASVGGFLFGRRRARRREVGERKEGDGVEKYRGEELAGGAVQELPEQERYELPPHGTERGEGGVAELEGVGRGDKGK